MKKNEILLESGTNELEILTFMLGDQTFGVIVNMLSCNQMPLGLFYLSN